MQAGTPPLPWLLWQQPGSCLAFSPPRLPPSESQAGGGEAGGCHWRGRARDGRWNEPGHCSALRRGSGCGASGWPGWLAAARAPGGQVSPGRVPGGGRAAPSPGLGPPGGGLRGLPGCCSGPGTAKAGGVGGSLARGAPRPP